MKWILGILAALVLLAIALVLLLIAVSRLYFKRSPMATIVELVLASGGNKKLLTTDVGSEAYIAERAAANRLPYQIPEAVRMEVPVAERQECGMQVFFLNEEARSDALIFYFHGGAYVSHPANEHWKLCNTASRDLGVPIVFPVYPKAPDHSCEDAYEGLLALYRAYSGRAERIVFMGDSAGAGLALGLAQALRDAGERQPQQLILLSPWLDVSMDNRDMEKYEKNDPMLGICGLKKIGVMWAGERGVHDPKASPIYGDMGGLGKVALFVGTREIFYPEVMKLSAMLKERDIPHDLFIGQGQNHVYPLYPTPEAKEAVQTIERLIADRT